eukprot:CAMPEP_0181493398 /NCGR_PEP_ID=MMETSP1110-20121109/51204_1 /TAXON_ID=174948 /ORGANISM="Symbiodinium sp., Strain CCMP421" /LENGTH=45 /DNA_ID= /DNA_START= /DNA_END= /DNA_ORIENTATION=
MKKRFRATAARSALGWSSISFIALSSCFTQCLWVKLIGALAWAAV